MVVTTIRPTRTHVVVGRRAHPVRAAFAAGCRGPLVCERAWRSIEAVVDWAAESKPMQPVPRRKQQPPYLHERIRGSWRRRYRGPAPRWKPHLR
jgi:hypothetical protein